MGNWSGWVGWGSAAKVAYGWDAAVASSKEIAALASESGAKRTHSRTLARGLVALFEFKNTRMVGDLYAGKVPGIRLFFPARSRVSAKRVANCVERGKIRCIEEFLYDQT